jgi:hypothetical protein
MMIDELTVRARRVLKTQELEPSLTTRGRKTEVNVDYRILDADAHYYEPDDCFGLAFD